MSDEKIIPNNTEVYVFNKYGHRTKPIAKGVIVNSKDSGDLSQHGSPWSVQVYDVLGDDGINYYGAYANDLYNYYFRTKENYIRYLKTLILYNNEEISNLEENNNELKKLIRNVNKENEKPKQLVKKTMK